MDGSSLEFEIKVELCATHDVAQLLQSMHLVKRETVTDVYFDTVPRQLFTQGVFIRLRNSKLLEIKHNSDATDLAHLSCQDYKFAWPLKDAGRKAIARFLDPHLGHRSNKSTNDVFADFQLMEFVSLVKDRTIYSGPGVEVSLDRISGLGVFLEIEAKGPTGIQNAKRLSTEQGFQNVPIGYVELWLRKNDFATYRRGKYVLAKDKALEP